MLIDRTANRHGDMSSDASFPTVVAGAPAGSQAAPGGGETPPIIPAEDEPAPAAVSPVFHPASGTLTVIGDALDNAVVIGRDARGFILVNDAIVPAGGVKGAVPTVFNTKSISLFGLGGNDILSLDETNGPLPAAQLLGGLGNDVLIGGSGADSLFGQDGNDTLQGGSGGDQLFGGAGNDLVIGGRDADRIALGDGNDTARWMPGDGSDRIEGEAGFDTLAFDTSGADEAIAVSADGPRAVLTRDVGGIAMDVNGLERIDVQPVGGADRIAVGDLTGTGVQEVRIDLEGVDNGGVGDGKVDSITLDGTGLGDVVSVLGHPSGLFILGLPSFVTVQRADATDTIAINAGAGNDRIEAGSIAAGAGTFAFDGGDGNDVVFGTRGHDVLLGGAGNDFIDGGRGSDVALLGAGDDTFVWEPGDGNDFVEGGAGFDGVRLSGNSANEVFAVSALGGQVGISRDVDGARLDTDDAELISLLSFGGSDRFEIHDLSGTGVQAVEISLFDFAVPGGASDVVVIDGTAGDDTIRIVEDAGVITVLGLAATIRITGTDAAGDRLEIRGLGGNDSIDASDVGTLEIRVLADGGAGNDTILGGAGDDVLSGGDGADVGFAGSGDNVAFGGGGDDVLRGEEGDDVLDGGAGSDILIGNAGTDVLLNGEVVFDQGRASPSEFLL
ncbi:calcium-binding protein [Inquilinus sp. Marseille-Q2685]|uniref:calcium-binding protein n=1 Tax=Inquilinus sp. Marseille-Q2685 TaxID=2866581 RepID=UPI001CE3FEFA|nr:calcium-binding protein [Inquilinus sp. Marseille-Q2685]